MRRINTILCVMATSVVIFSAFLGGLNLLSFIWLNHFSTYSPQSVKGAEHLLRNYYRLLTSKDPETPVSLNLEVSDLNPNYIIGTGLVLSNKPNSRILYCEESSGPIEFLTDKFGYRNKTFSFNYDLLLVGDSFTEGACVNEHSHIAALINNGGVFSAYNGGKGGTGLTYFAAAAKLLADEIKPKVIIVNILQGTSLNRMFAQNGTDRGQALLNIAHSIKVDNYQWEKIFRTLTIKLAGKKALISVDLVKSKKSLADAAKAAIRDTSLFSVYKIIQTMPPISVDSDGEGMPKCDRISAGKGEIVDSIEHLRKTAEHAKVKLVFFYFPGSESYLADVDVRFGEKIRSGIECERQMLTEVIQRSSPSMEFYDLSFVFEGFKSKYVREIFFAKNPNTDFGDVNNTILRGHYSEIGYKRMADAIQDILIKRRLPISTRK